MDPLVAAQCVDRAAAPLCLSVRCLCPAKTMGAVQACISNGGGGEGVYTGSVKFYESDMALALFRFSA
jgi:hypothetical protein